MYLLRDDESKWSSVFDDEKRRLFILDMKRNFAQSKTIINISSYVRHDFIM